MPLIYCAIPKKSFINPDKPPSYLTSADKTKMFTKDGHIEISLSISSLTSPTSPDFQNWLNTLVYKIGPESEDNSGFALRGSANVYCLYIEDNYFRRLNLTKDAVLIDTKFMEIIGIYVLPITGRSGDNIPFILLNTDTDENSRNTFKSFGEDAVKDRHCYLQKNGGFTKSFDPTGKIVVMNTQISVDGKGLQKQPRETAPKEAVIASGPPVAVTEKKNPPPQSSENTFLSALTNFFGKDASNKPAVIVKPTAYQVSYHADDVITFQTDNDVKFNQLVDALKKPNIRSVLGDNQLLVGRNKVSAYYDNFKKITSLLPETITDEIRPLIENAVESPILILKSSKK